MKRWLPAPAGTRTDLLAFTPMPRKHRVDGWTVERRRDFIAGLADTGSVATAKRVNMSTKGASFAAAWSRVQASGLQRLTDIAIDRATEGVAVPVFYKPVLSACLDRQSKGASRPARNAGTTTGC